MKYSFRPDRITKSRDKDFGLDYTEDEISRNPSQVYDKLYKDAEILSHRLDLKQKAVNQGMQEMSNFSSLSYRTSGNFYSIFPIENWDPNNQGRRFEKLYNDREKSENRQKEVREKVMKEEGCSFRPRTNKKINNCIKNDVITRNSKFLEQK